VLGLGLAAAGTAVLFPTLLGVLPIGCPMPRGGRATSIVTVSPTWGSSREPVYVGRWQDFAVCPARMFALAALAVVLAVLAPAGLYHIAVHGGRPPAPDAAPVIGAVL